MLSTQSKKEEVKISKALFQKMVFLTNALDKGWSIKKTDDSYIFTKKHEGKKEVFQSDYLEKFIESNLEI
jgi:hypothetical protein